MCDRSERAYLRNCLGISESCLKKNFAWSAGLKCALAQMPESEKSVIPALRATVWIRALPTRLCATVAAWLSDTWIIGWSTARSLELRPRCAASSLRRYATRIIALITLALTNVRWMWRPLSRPSLSTPGNEVKPARAPWYLAAAAMRFGDG